MVRKDVSDKGLTKGPCPPSHKNGMSIE